MGYRYIGSKEKLTDIIINEIREKKPSTRRVIDLMAGTGLFSKALREEGFDVTAVDVMTYSFHHLQVHLSMNQAPSFDGVQGLIDKEEKDGLLFKLSNYEKVLHYLNSVTGKKGYFFNEFSSEGNPNNSSKPRKYFSPQNAAKIDALRSEIKGIKERGYITSLEHSLLIHDLIMAVNDVANIAGTYGHYLSKFVKRATAPIVLKPSIFSKKGSTENHKIYCGYAEEISGDITGDFCYIDPPYIKRQYAANYHILETIAREDEPEAIGESGLRPWRDQYSNFCSKVNIRDSFDRIISNLDCEDILVSYSEDGLITIDELMLFLSRYGEVSKKDIEYKRFKSNASTKNSVLHEYLIHLKKVTPLPEAMLQPLRSDLGAR